MPAPSLGRTDAVLVPKGVLALMDYHPYLPVLFFLFFGLLFAFGSVFGGGLFNSGSGIMDILRGEVTDNVALLTSPANPQRDVPFGGGVSRA